LDMGARGLGSVSWNQVGRDETFGNISLLRRMDDIEELRQIGLIRVTVKLRDLFEAVDAVEWAGEGLGVFSVKDDAGNVLYTSSYGEDQEDNPFMLIRPIPGTEWQVEAAVPQHVFREEAGRI